MTASRRNVPVEDDSAWVFNRMAGDYDSRPPYPSALIDEIARHVLASGRRVLDIGAGIGHISLPLAQRGFDVVALEPARLMLERLTFEASRQGIGLKTLHCAAESLPFEKASFDAAIIADALHFLDINRVAAQLRRILAPSATLVVVTCGFAPTPFMREVQKCIAQFADRRARDVSQALRSLASLSGFRMNEDTIICDETPLDALSLERVLRTVSFVGPAMAGERFQSLRAQVLMISHSPAWARRFTVRIGHRRASAVSG